VNFLELKWIKLSFWYSSYQFLFHNCTYVFVCSQDIREVLSCLLTVTVTEDIVLCGKRDVFPLGKAIIYRLGMFFFIFTKIEGSKKYFTASCF